ncbi:hypothetical protein NQF87_08475 [Bombella sp. TMW 2.2559]|uniref:DUF2335 domain-containing protein n=1 Tax=Bombella dulcis TaxID=2967339 RepID=A0ABT3WD66_9PROT|nr:hypothetical protein [Bombella dulcis]MCX5617001.1 hypothetical protein [Bombella dulcis]
MTDSEEAPPRKYSSPAGAAKVHTISLGGENLQTGIVQASKVVHTQKLHVGPLPSASDLEAYSKIGKNGEVLDLILAMARKNNETQNDTAYRAQWFAFLSDISRTFIGLIFGLGCLSVAYKLAIHDHMYVAGIVATTTLLIGLAVLVIRTLPTKAGPPSLSKNDEK